MRHAIAVIACLATLFLCGCGGSGEDFQVATEDDLTSAFSKGDTAVLRPRPDDEEEDPAASSYFAKSHAALRKFTVEWVTKPLSARQDMIAAGELFEVTTPTQCKILEERKPGYKIELTEGEYSGKTGWAWEAHLRSE